MKASFRQCSIACRTPPRSASCRAMRPRLATKYAGISHLPHKPDIVGVIEAAYRVEQDEHPWLGAVLEASRPLLDRGLGLLGAIYDVSEPAHPSASTAAGFDLPPMFDVDTMRDAFRGLSADSVRSLVTTSGCHVIPWERRFCEIPGEGGLASLPVVPSPFGPSDMLVINAADPTGRGCFVSVNHHRRKAPSRNARHLW